MRMEKYTSPASYSYAGLLSAFGAITLNEWAVIVGILTGVGTFIVNWYYKHKESKAKIEMIKRAQDEKKHS